jgi:hypothetical protein
MKMQVLGKLKCGISELLQSPQVRLYEYFHAYKSRYERIRHRFVTADNAIPTDRTV